MKKLCLALLLLSCYTAKAQKANVGLNLVKGATYYNISTSNTTLVQTVNGQAIEIGIVVAGKMSFTVTGVRDSLYDMQVKYDSLNIAMQTPNGKIAASSENSAADIMSQILVKMKSRSFSVVMSKTGRVNSVSGVDALFKNAMDSLSNVPEQQKKSTIKQLMQSFGSDAFKGSLEIFTYIFPAKKPAKNDKWVIDNQVISTMKLNIHTLYLLKDITAGNYIIEGTSTVTTENKDYTDLNGMPVKYNLAGTINKMIKADKATGWITEAVLNQSLKGNAEIKDNPKLPGGLLIPMTITSKTTVGNK